MHAAIYPGQGAQIVGMGKDVAEAHPVARAVFAQADRILGFSLSSLCFDGPAERLEATDIQQPAIFTTSVAIYRAAVEAGLINPDAIAAMGGLSLGEYTALHLAGAISFADALRVVALRGRAMQDAAEASRGSMVALIGADENQAREICAQAAPAGSGAVLAPANFNAPGQIVASGSVGACDEAVMIAEKMGLRATRLSVAGAFHSPLMQPAADRLAAALADVEIKAPTCPVVSNVTAKPHEDAPSIRNRLVEQLTAPVRWDESCRWLAANVKGEMHELAPGKVLAGLMRRIDRAVKVETHDEP